MRAWGRLGCTNYTHVPNILSPVISPIFCPYNISWIQWHPITWHVLPIVSVTLVMNSLMLTELSFGGYFSFSWCTLNLLKICWNNYSALRFQKIEIHIELMLPTILLVFLFMLWSHKNINANARKSNSKLWPFQSLFNWNKTLQMSVSVLLLQRKVMIFM